MTFLKNVWYFAAQDDDFISDQRLTRTILGEAVLLYRAQEGTVHAIGDRCAHRFAPLHLGKIIGDRVECPYHGLQFDPSGACVHNPHGDGKISQGNRVKSYPLVHRDTIFWIWMGAPELADPSKIPDYSFIGRADPVTRMAQTIYCRCNYELLTDNILDLTHGDYIHLGLLGTGALTKKGAPRVWEDGDAIYIEWFVARDLLLPGFNEMLPDPAAPADSWLTVRWDAPASMMLEVGVTPSGRPRAEGVRSINLHVMTPADESDTHYFTLTTRDYAPTREYNEVLKEILRVAFIEQDKPILEAQQKSMGTPNLWSLNPVLLSSDVGAVRVRRALERMIAQEQSVPA